MGKRNLEAAKAACQDTQEALVKAEDALAGTRKRLKVEKESLMEEIKHVEQEAPPVPHMDGQRRKIDKKWAEEVLSGRYIWGISMLCIFEFDRLADNTHARLGKGIRTLNGLKLWAITSGAVTKTFDARPEKELPLPNRIIRNDIGKIFRRFHHLICAARVSVERGGLIAGALADMETLLSELEMVTFKGPRHFPKPDGRFFIQEDYEELRDFLTRLVEEQKVVYFGTRFDRDWGKHDLTGKFPTFDQAFSKYSSPEDQLRGRKKIQSELILKNMQRRHRFLRDQPGTPDMEAWRSYPTKTPDEAVLGTVTDDSYPYCVDVYKMRGTR
ncbi:unnamed protein product [Clonostachys rosea]|uniref:Uncharacterized protein n=1 Tax=Bionectria ochroleuca TaxID=29856 RepID=A0ABY6UQJ5_BIOOC|nr:unnamed protein product [Clonostachys rosea]